MSDYFWTAVILLIAGLAAVFVLVAYAIGWAILFVAGMFWGYQWPGFWYAWLLGFAILILIAAMKGIVRSEE